VLIAETKAFGRGLFLNGVPQAFAADERDYHTALAQPALHIHDDPRDVLLVGCSDGGTLREILRHRRVERVTMVDIDKDLVEACRQHLRSWHHGAFEDPRVTLCFSDIQSWLKQAAPHRFDVIILALGDPEESGPSTALWTDGFFTGMRTLLKAGGVLATQAGEVEALNASGFRTIAHTLAASFAHTVTYSLGVPSFFAEWGFILGSDQALPLDAASLQQRVAMRRIIEWHGYDATSHQAILTSLPVKRQRLQPSGSQNVTAMIQP
jgi:spermidine synthase